MADERFFDALGPFALSVIAEATKASLSDPADGDREVRQAASLDDAGPGAITFLANPKHADRLSGLRATAVFVTKEAAAMVPPGCAALVSAWPQAAWAAAVHLLHRPRRHDGVDGAIHPTAVIEPGVILGPGVAVGPGARIGQGTFIAANAVIGPGVAIGRNCSIGASTSVTFALVGDRVLILAGVRIGEAGFGVAPSGKGPVDVPQLGRVILQDGVTIGANSCIDRGSLSDTLIGENSKFDNLCHIAHGVRIGRNCVAAGDLGVAGSVVIGDGVQFGGRVGIRDHVSIGDGASVAAASMVFKDVPAGETWAGYPAKPIASWKRESVTLAKLVRDRGRK